MKSTSFRISDAQRRKLRALATALEVTPNAAVGQLIDNAQIAIVTRHEAVATLPAQKNNRRDAKVSQGPSITAVQG